MSEAEVIGMFVIGATALVALFTTVYKPLNENTKAMTTLAVKMEQLTEQMRKQEEDFRAYKDSQTESQRRQWEVINENSETLAAHDAEIRRMKGA